MYIMHSLVTRLRLVRAKDMEITKEGPFPDGYYLVVETGNERNKLTRQGIRKVVMPGDGYAFRIDKSNAERIAQRLQEDSERLP